MNTSNEIPQKRKQNKFAIAALCCSILAFMNCYIIYICMIFASLAIIFAILSKGEEIKMQLMPKLSIMLVTIGVAISVIFTSAIAYTVYQNPELFKEQLNTVSEQMYGMDFDELMNSYQ